VAEQLAALERYMQALLTHPDGPQRGAETEAARAALAVEIDDVFLPSKELTPAERVGVYADMYFVRLVDDLEDEIRGLTHLLGHERAHALFQEYVHAHPSRHYSLNQLGLHLEAFVRDEATDVEPRAFAVELARLERALQDVFDAPECASLGADAIASVPGAVGTTTLALIVGEKRPLTPLTLDGVIPSLKTIAGGTYPHTKTIYVITRHQEAHPAVAGFVQFLQTPEARALVAATGFLPLPARPSP